MADGSGFAAQLKVVGFAGGGGSSVAVKLATGCDPDLAMNHWLTAVRAHQRHFPATEHYCADIFDVDPAAWRPGEEIAFGWFSPDCTDFSKAKGKAPRAERIRGLGWSVIPWAVARRIKVIMLENVEEFAQWGPVYRCADDVRALGVPGSPGEPIKALRGATFARWKSRLEALGYVVEWRVLNAADYGAPTTRKRLYLVARCDDKPIVWPARTHAPRKDAERLGLKPWRGACEIIDWGLDCPSIFLTSAEVDDLRKATGKRVQRPLVAATLKRIARGMERYVIGAADPFIVPITQKGWNPNAAHDVRDPLKTITSAKGGEFAVAAPTLASVAHGGEARAWPVGEPARTQTGKHDKALASASLVQMNTRDVGAAAIDPLRTHIGKDHQGLVTGSLVPRYGEREGQTPRAIGLDGPLPTIVPGVNGGDLAAAHLVRQFGSAAGGRDAADPLNTVMAQGERGGGKDQLVTAYMAQGNGERLGRAADDPTTTQTNRGTQQQLLSASLDAYYSSGSVGSDVVQPMRAATGTDRLSLVAYWLEQANTGMTGHPATAPVSTIVGGGGADSGWGPTQRLVEAWLEQEGGAVGRRGAVLSFLWAHFGLPTADEIADPVATLQGRLKFGLVIIKGATWMIVDIGLRMLTPAELAAAMGLPAEYDLSCDLHGQPISKTHQTQMIGNMVSPPPAAALIAANCPDLIKPDLMEAA